MRIAHRHRQAGRASSGTPRSNRAAERGAALVELAMVALFLLTISGAAFDFGMTWRVTLIDNEAARAGARTGSTMADDPLADWYALSNARAALSSGKQLANVQRVVIYRSDTANGAVPSGCTSGTTTSSLCNVLTGAQFSALAQTDFNTTTGCINAGKATVTNWCPNVRDNVQLTANYFGIWIDIKYTNLFKLRGASIDITRTAVMRLEPDVS